MTEFNLEKDSDDYSRSFGLCITGDLWGGSTCDVNVDWLDYFHNICGTMTDGGDYLVSDSNGGFYKLGTCGLEQIGERVQYFGGRSQFCGKIKGGAAFCHHFYCYVYSDETGEITQLPWVRFIFHIRLIFYTGMGLIYFFSSMEVLVSRRVPYLLLVKKTI